MLYFYFFKIDQATRRDAANNSSSSDANSDCDSDCRYSVATVTSVKRDDAVKNAMENGKILLAGN